MSDPRPKELILAEKHLYNGKISDAFEILEKFEKKNEITPKEQLWSLILRAWVDAYKFRISSAVELGIHAYLMSKELGMVPETIESLIIKAYSFYIGNLEEGFECVLEAENLIDTLNDETSINYIRLKQGVLNLKSFLHRFKYGNYQEALDFLLESLNLADKIGNKLMVAHNRLELGYLYLFRGDPNTSLDHVMKALEFFKEIEFHPGIAHSLFQLGGFHLFKGDLDQALESVNQSLSHKEVSKFTKNACLDLLGAIYRDKGELEKSLEYLKQTKPLNDINIAETYRQMGELDAAIEYYEKALKSIYSIIYSPLYLILTYLEKGNLTRAQEILDEIKIPIEQSDSKLGKQAYQLGKAALLKTSKRRRNLAEAEILLKGIVEDEILDRNFTFTSLIFLCDLLLEELSVYNNSEVLEEIRSLINRLLMIAENQHSFLWLAEGKLLQAKTALIQMNLDNAKLLFTEAQQIADKHGLNLLAQKISNEHDILLEKLDEWEKLKKNNATMAERIDLASVEGDLNRLKGKQAVDPPELVNEESILLLIMDGSGTTYFNHPFVANWDHSDLFSSFMSAFNTFSDEIFSKSIDRIRIGENTILINPLESFLVCYVIKGQSYPALQKLTRFTEDVRENPEIWQALNKSVKTSEMLDLDKPPALKVVINEIFTQ